MASPRKPRPTFDTPKPATPATPAPSPWAYRTDAVPEGATPPPSAPAPVPAAPATPAAQGSAVSSVVYRLVMTPVTLAALLVLAPVSWLVGPSRPR